MYNAIMSQVNLHPFIVAVKHMSFTFRETLSSGKQRYILINAKIN